MHNQVYSLGVDAGRDDADIQEIKSRIEHLEKKEKQIEKIFMLLNNKILEIQRELQSKE